MVPSYDHELNLIYIGTSVTSPAPKYLIGGVGNKHLYHNSTLAIDADTGRIVWYYQHIVDHWDLDHTFERILLDTEVAPAKGVVAWINPTIKPGEKRKVLTGVPGASLGMCDETFAPVAYVNVFDTEAEAIARANDTVPPMSCELYLTTGTAPPFVMTTSPSTISTNTPAGVYCTSASQLVAEYRDLNWSGSFADYALGRDGVAGPACARGDRTAVVPDARDRGRLDGSRPSRTTTQRGLGR